LKRSISKGGLTFLRRGHMSFWLMLFPLLACGQSTEKLSLNDAIMIALQNNSDIIKAQKEIDAAGGRILQAGRIPNPELSVNWNETPTNLNIGDADERDIGLSQEIEFPGKRGARIDVAEHEKVIVELSLDRIKTLTISRVKRSYYQVLLTGETITSLESTISLLNDFLKQVTERYQAGSSTYLDVIRTKVETTRLGNELVEARRDQQQRIAELNILLGRLGETPVTLSDSLQYEPLQLSRDSVLVQYSVRSSFLQLAEREALRGQSLVSLAKKSYLPDFSFGLFHQQRAEEPPFNANDFSGITTRSLGLQLGISVPLWFWQQPRGQVEEAQAIVDIAAIQVEAARRRVRQSIINAYQLASVANQQVQVFQTSLLRDAEDELRAGISGYQNNQIDVLNLFDIYRTYRATKIEYARALYNYLAAKAELDASAEVPE